MQRLSNIKQMQIKIDSISMGIKLTVGFALITILTLSIAIYSLLELKKEVSFIEQMYHVSQGREESIIFYLILAILISIGLSVIIAVTTIRSIVTPIRQLIGLTQEINDGKVILHNNSTMKKIARREDEIGLLFNSFTRLMEHLLLPYENITQSDRPLVDKTDEVKRLLDSFDKYIIASKTDVEGIITYVSLAFQGISGYSREELIGKSHNISRHPDMPKEIFADMWKTIKSGNIWSGEIKNRTKDGNFYWVKTTVSPDIDSKNTIVGYKEICENITSAKAYEELSKTLENRVLQEIIKNNEKTAHMIQQSRLAQMGEMISMIAHQWRQPLSSISAISGTLSLDVMMKNYNEDFFQEQLNSIGELSQYLSQTIDDFRGFFKKDKMVEKASVDEIVNSCLHVIGLSLQNKNINVIMRIDEKSNIESYINELKQVILNILKNAEDALLENNIENATISIRGYQKELNTYIEIEDNAGGVSEEIKSRIFDPYFSTKSKKDGTGLGLYMSKIIVEEHCGGALELYNTEVGARFIIILPIKNEEILLEAIQ